VRARAGVVVAALTLTLSVAACGAGSSPATGPGTTTATRRPEPTRTVVKAYRTYRVGQSASVGRGSATLRITIGRPSVSDRRLSSSYGDAPRYGHYVTFPVSITSTGSATVVVQRLDFVVRTAAARKTTTDDGNAPFSGAATQLDTTPVEPGGHVHNRLTFDLRDTHGLLRYAPGSTTVAAWRF
jgi:hypothetical protein